MIIFKNLFNNYFNKNVFGIMMCNKFVYASLNSIFVSGMRTIAEKFDNTEIRKLNSHLILFYDQHTDCIPLHTSILLRLVFLTKLIELSFYTYCTLDECKSKLCMVTKAHIFIAFILICKYLLIFSHLQFYSSRIL